MILGKDVTMVMFSSSPPPLCRSVAVCISTLKMGGKEMMFPYHYEAHSAGYVCLKTTQIPSLWIFGSCHGLGDMCQTEVIAEHEITLPRSPCALLCYLSWDKATWPVSW